MVAEETIYRKLSRVIRFHRRKGRLSQLALARLAGVGKTAVFDVEHGKKTVQLDTLLKILKVLNIRIQLNSPLMDSFGKEENAKSQGVF